MEKFYIAEEGSKLKEDYLKYLSSAEEVRKLVIKFFETHGITANEYYAGNSFLHIVPTKEDKEKLKNELCKPKNGLCRFKVNSRINKAWVEALKQFNIEIIPKPRVPFYFNYGFGSTSSRLLEINGVVYCSLKSEFECEPRDKLMEIKGSEFYKAVEEYNESLQERGV